jgi:hypothetical protein
MPDRWVIVLHLLSTAYMTGLVWFVQAVHYPLMVKVGSQGFADYERRHQSRTTWVVAPPMLLELATAAALLYRPPAGIPPVWAWVGAGLLAIVWLSTFALQVPCHERLSRGFDEAAWRRLVATNWIRTAAWSGRCVIAAGMASSAFGAP